ncbi:ATP-binding protein [Sphaerotilus mobilis]|uniref:Serine/threonine-protein kinase RsbT n=1 Tax=Sphaerotilus mobilis TaxID=47994 RepID=A0A4Q7LR11_9BURK|nr:ATP-binding protein [Sphaerotilus mobilis]RZS57164.1 serine/threonine-protein kinase RsbT [Sphaerotilus mobilis]
MTATHTMLDALTLRVGHEGDVAHVIASVMRFCNEHAHDGVFAAHVATAASELANNLWMHTPDGGEIRLHWLDSGKRRGVELRADDRGPGIPDLALAMTEGYSTGGGMGCGLPGVERLMDDFDIRSEPGSGTHVLAHKWLRRR